MQSYHIEGTHLKKATQDSGRSGKPSRPAQCVEVEVLGPGLLSLLRVALAKQVNSQRHCVRKRKAVKRNLLYLLAASSTHYTALARKQVQVSGSNLTLGECFMPRSSFPECASKAHDCKLTAAAATALSRFPHRRLVACIDVHGLISNTVTEATAWQGCVLQEDSTIPEVIGRPNEHDRPVLEIAARRQKCSV